MTTASDRWTDRWAWLAVVPSTNMKLVSVVLLNFSTFLLVVVLLFLEKKPVEFIFDGWLVLLGALNGAAVGNYLGKRLTDTDYRAAKNATTQPNVPQNVSLSVTSETPVPPIAPPPDVDPTRPIPRQPPFGPAVPQPPVVPPAAPPDEETPVQPTQPAPASSRTDERPTRDD